ncbi:hypothetical protein [Bacillus mycoides]|uniref:Uncharacterized protein n=1 Tax=Bacillus mycoides (strain KBAB4) TaxID=315730 RepID=A9VVI8_BACMK|nr:hypothetical protein [Bacillus mycoides]ABY46803.1 hypothetical protein BcerKBAB4_5309 [Bacillus mycoides KBAB4]
MSSFIVSTGAQAVEDATTEKVDYSKLLTKVQNGKTLLVRALPTAVVKYHCHSVYKSFYSTPCTKPMGKEDLYDKACDLLYKDAKEAEEAGATEAEVKVIKDRAYAIKAKERYMIGFVSLDTGLPIIVDLTATQGREVIAVMKKYEKKIDKRAFEITKTGSSTDTKISFTIVVDTEDDLEPKQFEQFEKSLGHEFDMESFGKVFSINDEAQQIEDLIAFGFDIERLGLERPAEKSEKPADEDF